MIDQPGVRRNLVSAHGDHRHRFGPARDHHLGAAAHDALRRHGNRLQAGRAEAIDGHRGHFNWQTRAQRRNAGHIHPLLALRHGAAQNNVFNLFGIKLRHAIERAFDRNGSQFIGTSSPQRTLVRAAHRSANGRNYDDFSHGVILLRRGFVWERALSRACPKRSRRVQAEPSSAPCVRHSNLRLVVGSGPREPVDPQTVMYSVVALGGGMGSPCSRIPSK